MGTHDIRLRIALSVLLMRAQYIEKTENCSREGRNCVFSVPTLNKTKCVGIKIAGRKVQMRLLAKFPKAKTGKYWDCVSRLYILGIM